MKRYNLVRFPVTRAQLETGARTALPQVAAPKEDARWLDARIDDDVVGNDDGVGDDQWRVVRGSQGICAAY